MGPGTDTSKLIGFFEIDLNATLSGSTAPADATIAVEIATTNAVGQPMEGNVSWRLDITGPTSVTHNGDGNSVHETITLPERGTYTVTLTATAPRYHEASVTQLLVLDPLPLQADFALENASRGDWITLDATATEGYSDLGYTCTWSETPALLVLNATECVTSARWLLDGNQTATVTVDDGHANTTVAHNITLAPLPAVPMPTAAPSDAQIDDTGDGPQLPPVNITAAWFDSDLTHLFIGMTVEGLPNGQATRGNTYTVSFTPSWNATLASGQVEAFRVTATHPVTPDNPTAPAGTRHFDLDARVGGTWENVASVGGGAVSTDDGLFWWPVLRSDLQAPLVDGVISDLAASTAGAGEDSASGTGGYELD